MRDPEAEWLVDAIKEIVTDIRRMKQDAGIPHSEWVDVNILLHEPIALPERPGS